MNINYHYEQHYSLKLIFGNFFFVVKIHVANGAVISTGDGYKRRNKPPKLGRSAVHGALLCTL